MKKIFSLIKFRGEFSSFFEVQVPASWKFTIRKKLKGSNFLRFSKRFSDREIDIGKWKSSLESWFWTCWSRDLISGYLIKNKKHDKMLRGGGKSFDQLLKNQLVAFVEFCSHLETIQLDFNNNLPSRIGNPLNSAQVSCPLSKHRTLLVRPSLSIFTWYRFIIVFFLRIVT